MIGNIAVTNNKAIRAARLAVARSPTNNATMTRQTISAPLTHRRIADEETCPIRRPR
jgi:hypothetical protein